jgi:hypothetical protein
MIDGRDDGEVKEFSFDDAQALLKTGKAQPVNFNEADPLAKRIEVAEVPTDRVEPVVVARAAEPVAKFLAKKRFGRT